MDFNEPVNKNGPHFLIDISLLSAHKSILCGEDLLCPQHLSAAFFSMLCHHLRIINVRLVNSRDSLVDKDESLFFPEFIKSLFFEIS
jgi:hypothetical protein